MSNHVEKKALEVLQRAVKTRLYGEIVFRFRDGEISFITETRTIPGNILNEERTNEYRSNR